MNWIVPSLSFHLHYQIKILVLLLVFFLNHRVESYMRSVFPWGFKEKASNSQH